MLLTITNLSALAAGGFFLLLAASRLKALSAPFSYPPDDLVLSYRLGWVLLLYGVLASLGIASVTGNMEDDTTLGYVFKFLDVEPYWDSWNPMWMAIEHIRKNPDQPVYGALFFEQGVKFQYPLSALLPFDIVERRKWFGDSWDGVFRHVNILCWYCVLALGIVAGQLLRSDTGVSATPRSNEVWYRSPKTVWLMVLSIAVVVCFSPVSVSYRQGQIQTPMVLMAALAMLSFQRNKTAQAGFWIGLCCAIKPHWGIIIAWALLRRQYRMAAVASMVFAGLLGAAILRYGATNVLDYFHVLSFLGRHGEAFFANHSFNGLANRLLFNGGELNLSWIIGPPEKSFPPFNPIVHAVTLGTTIVLLAAALLWRFRQPAHSLDLAIVMLSLTIASPIAWGHHYGILVPVCAVLWREMLFKNRGEKWPYLVLGIAYFLTSQKLDFFTHPLAYTAFNWLQSYILFGGLMILALLYRQTRSIDR